MEEIEVKSCQEAKAEQKRPAAALFFLAAGVFGILSIFHNMAGASFPTWAAYPAAFISCWLCWYTYYGKRKNFYLTVIVLSAGCAAAVFLMWGILGEQIRYMGRLFAHRDAGQTASIMETVLLLAVMLPLFMAILDYALKSHEILYLLTMLMLLAAPLAGIRAGIGSMLLIVLYQTAFWVMQSTVSSGYSHLPAYQVSFFGIVEEILFSGQGKVVFGGVEKHRLAGRSSIVAGAALMAVFVIVFPVSLMCQEKVFDSVYNVDGAFRRAVSVSSGSAAQPVTGGKISRGNNYPTGTPHLELMASGKQPAEMLYLKGFSGGQYIGGNWIRSNDAILFENIVEKNDWWEWERIISNRYNNMYYLLNENMRSGEPPRPVSITITHYSGGDEDAYVPYYSQRGRIYYFDDVWRDMGYGNSRDGYIYRYYEQTDMNIQWDNVLTNFEETRDWYKQMQEAYMEECLSAYTVVPTEILPRLTQLCQENPLDSLEEITAFILYILHSNAEYSLTPGWAPMNEDIVEYFLFESGRGYCEHFAATATLMYRLYGVPARYATGYMIAPEDFEGQSYGSDNWRSIVTDEDAHAWVEIFLEDYGWTPVEVTPALDGSSAAVFPGFDNKVFQSVKTQRGWDADAALFPQTAEESRYRDWGEGIFSIDYEKYEKFFTVAGVCMVYSLLLLPFFLDYRRLRRLKRMEKADCRMVFFMLLKMLRFGKCLDDLDGTEEDFVQKLARQFPGVAEEDIAKMQEIVSRKAYGAVETAPEEEAYVREVYERLAQEMYGMLKWHKKLVFRYIKTFT